MSNEDELIWGADAMAAEINRNPRQTFYLLTTGAIPTARKVGGRWVVSRRQLWQTFLGDTEAAPSMAAPVLVDAIARFLAAYRDSGAPPARTQEAVLAAFPQATSIDFAAGLAEANRRRATAGDPEAA